MSPNPQLNSYVLTNMATLAWMWHLTTRRAVDLPTALK